MGGCLVEWGVLYSLGRFCIPSASCAKEKTPRMRHTPAVKRHTGTVSRFHISFGLCDIVDGYVCEQAV